MSSAINLKISGMHCASCKVLIESELKNLLGVNDVRVDYPSGEAELKIDQNKIGVKKIIAKVKELGYGAELVSEKSKSQNKTSDQSLSRSHTSVYGSEAAWDDFEIRAVKYILIGLGVILLIGVYFLLNQSGALQIFSRLQDNKLSYGLLFLIGILASFHCVGMCGGLVVTYSASHHLRSENQNKFLPHAVYNVGRIISYTLIGGILGGIGSFFGINPIFSGVMMFLAALFMILMGLSLIKNFNLLEKIKSKFPSFVAKYLFFQKQSVKPKGPFTIGLLNSLMPCGPLQAVQFYALGTGSVLTGSLSMFFYALGTVFLMFGFGYFISSISGERIKRMMKLSGAVVVVLGLFMLNRGLANFGFGYKAFLPQNRFAVQEQQKNDKRQEYQIVKMDLTYRGYVPNVLYVKRGVPVRWVINVKQMSGCTDAILMEKFGIRKDLKYGENIIEFTPTEVGEIPFSCWMKMVWGKFIVTNN